MREKGRPLVKTGIGKLSHTRPGRHPADLAQVLDHNVNPTYRKYRKYLEKG